MAYIFMMMAAFLKVSGKTTCAVTAKGSAGMLMAAIILASFATTNAKEAACTIISVAFRGCRPVLTAVSCATTLNLKVCGRTTLAATDRVPAGLLTAPLIPVNFATTNGKVAVRMSMKTVAFIPASFKTTCDPDMACE